MSPVCLILTILKRDRLLLLREGANTDHPLWALVLYTRAAVFASSLMLLAVLALVIGY